MPPATEASQLPTMQPMIQETMVRQAAESDSNAT
jgi:hypothetical protein